MNIPPYKILFICSSLEPGKDGVGDYTRKLACALIGRGYDAAIIALNDRRMEGDMWQGKQVDENMQVAVLRLSESLSWKKRLGIAKQFADNFKADWMSLQYVPFGFHLKGLPFNLGKKLKLLSENDNWHIMFHELSVNRDESFKFRIWSLLQMKIIHSLIIKLQPAVIHTNTELYKYRLKEIGFEATVLPLFSNISFATTKVNEPVDDIPPFLSQHRDEYIIGTLFGSFDFKRWDMRSLLNKFNYSFIKKKRVLVVSIGRMPAGQDCWEQLQKEYPQVVFFDLGERSPGFISYWLSHYTDFGILTTLPELAGKSGSCMAFKEHGIPVVCTTETAALKRFRLPPDTSLTVVREEKNFELPRKYQPVSVLDKVADQFINDLEKVNYENRATT